ncbi:hypothetical protein [Pseudonocardia sp. KRD291]|uniref:hypothetical protein n=1 Tax=Pseudonocardia sp. KRD291 TaxID=2792007 RepID=UPI001C4A3E0A|nr:hypothetical protein [Pseudonocardia sp. KRD291]MBW0101800.1 hypothetical protein [Pseudonocardia sp. KRD291]
MSGPEHGGEATQERRHVGEPVGGEPVCLMHRVCPECGRLADEDPPTRCPHCEAVIDEG